MVDPAFPTRRFYDDEFRLIFACTWSRSSSPPKLPIVTLKFHNNYKLAFKIPTCSIWVQEYRPGNPLSRILRTYHLSSTGVAWLFLQLGAMPLYLISSTTPSDPDKCCHTICSHPNKTPVSRTKALIAREIDLVL